MLAGAPLSVLPLSTEAFTNAQLSQLPVETLWTNTSVAVRLSQLPVEVLRQSVGAAAANRPVIFIAT